MTPGYRGGVCVAIVLFMTFVANGAVPESPKGKQEHRKTTDASKDSITVPRNSRAASSKAQLTFNCIEEDLECNKDKFGYEAIVQLHRLLDDDRNGNVDQSESDEFLRDELQYTDGFERHSLFHNNDKLISVDDLWRAWKFSEVYNWTVEDVVDWLEKEVDLPQYCSIFTENTVSGPFLPRLASSNTFMTTVLGIKNPVHKQKLSLKAMDTVLFGAPPKRHSYIKDVVLVASLIFAVGGCWFAYLHHRYSQEQVRKMMIDLESLQKAEEALMDVQRKLEDAENRQMSAVPQPPPDFKEGTAVPHADLPPGEEGSREGTRQIREELAATQLALQLAETQLENSWAPPGELQAWLQLTHELEQIHYTAKRQAAERQFQAAKDVCDKIKRRNKAFFGSLRMAHSNSLDQIDERIMDARVALEEVKQDLQERLHRWHTIERLCAFPVISNPGLSTLHQLLYGIKEGTGNGGRVPGVVGPLSVDEADEDMPPAGYPTLPQSISNKSFLRQRTIMGSTGSLSHLSRNVVNVSAAFSTPHPVMHRGGSHETDSPSPTSATLTSPVSFHLGDQVPERSLAVSHKNQHGIPGISAHTRTKSFTPSTISSIASSTQPHPLPSVYHGQAGAVPGPALGKSASGVFSHNRSMRVDDSDDNLSQATMESLPRSQSSGVMRDRQLLSNGLDLVSHTHRDSELLPPCRLEKKPSKRKKLLNMFRKTPKQKPV